MFHFRHTKHHHHTPTHAIVFYLYKYSSNVDTEDFKYMSEIYVLKHAKKNTFSNTVLLLSDTIIVPAIIPCVFIYSLDAVSEKAQYQ